METQEDDIEVGIITPDDISKFLPHESGKRNLIPTGIMALDKSLEGGARPGQLHLVCAYTGHGKSSFAVQLARVAAAYGHPCSILFHQMTEDEYKNRLAAWESGHPYRNHPPSQLPEGVLLEDLRKNDAPKMDGLEAYVASMGDDPEPVLIVDSIDALYFSRHDLEECCKHLADVAEKTGAAIWATTQANDSGNDTATVTIASLRDSQGKAFTASLVLGIGRTSQDDEKGIVTITADKNRHGRRFQVRARVDYPRQRFSDADDTFEVLPDHSSPASFKPGQQRINSAQDYSNPHGFSSNLRTNKGI